MKEEYRHSEVELMNVASDQSICQASPVNGGLEGTGEEFLLYNSLPL